MDRICAVKIRDYRVIYIDDILVYSHTFEEHLQHLQTVFNTLRKYNLKLKRKKCDFAANKLQFLGHVISKEGVEVDKRKIEAIQKYGIVKDPNNPTKEPRNKLSNVTEVRTFLGMTGYYSKFVDGYEQQSKPLTSLLSAKTPFVWNEEKERSMKQLKENLTKAPILRYPNSNKTYIIRTDASDVGIGASLLQRDENGDLHQIAYAGRQLTPAEKNYDTTNREGLAVYWALWKKFRYYVEGYHFELQTDHAALKEILNHAVGLHDGSTDCSTTITQLRIDPEKNSKWSMPYHATQRTVHNLSNSIHHGPYRLRTTATRRSKFHRI